MRLRPVFLAAVSSLALLGASLHASAGGQAADFAKRAQIRRLFKATQAEEKGHRLLAKAVESMRDKLSEEDLRDLEAAMAREVHYESLLDELVSVFDRHFTREEIDGLVAFFESPVGAKYARELPAIDREADPVVRKWANEASGHVIQSFVAARKARASSRVPASK